MSVRHAGRKSPIRCLKTKGIVLALAVAVVRLRIT
jgi:hypothetical protein